MKRAAALRLRKYRNLHGAFLVEGADLVAAGICHGYRPQTVFVREGSAVAAELEAARAASADAPPGRGVAWVAALPESSVAVVTQRVAERLTTLETPPDVSAVFPLLQPPPLAGAAVPEALLVYADHLADPGNLGTLLRAAAAFGATAFVTSPDTADHLAPKVVRASMGAIFSLPIYAGLTLDDVLQAFGGKDTAARAHVYGLAAHGGADLRSADLRRPAVLCVGAERAGLTEHTAGLADTLLTIPLAGRATVTPAPGPQGDAVAALSGEVESLNAGVAGAIALYEFWCRSGGASPACASRGQAPPADADARGAPPSGTGSHSRQTKR